MGMKTELKTLSFPYLKFVTFASYFVKYQMTFGCIQAFFLKMEHVGKVNLY